MRFSYFDTRSPAGWRAWDRVNADVTDRAVVVASGVAPVSVTGVVDVVDIDVDDCGDVHALDATGTVHRYDPETGSMVRLPCLGRDHDTATDPRALCVGPETIYVADGADGVVRAYSRDLLQLRWVSDDRFDDPIGMVHDGSGPAVLTIGLDPGTGQLVHLGPDGGVAAVVSGLQAPSDVTVDRAGNRYVLDVDEADGDGSAVIRVFPAGDTPPAAAASETASVSPLDEPLAAASCIAAINVDELLVAVEPATAGETTLYCYRLRQQSLETVDRFERGCTALAIAPGRDPDDMDAVYAIDAMADANEVYRLDGRRKVRRNDRTGRYDAQLFTRLDAGERGTRWHRVTLDLDHKRRDTQVRLSFAATEDDTKIADSSDLQRIDGIGRGYATRLRDAGVTHVRALAAADPETLAETIDVSVTNTTRWIDHAGALLIDWCPLGDPNPSDALLLAATGRYLWLKITLIGNEYATPEVSAIRTYFPRQSYLRHLPAVYREDAASAAFLERFLSLFESLFTGVEEDIERVTRYMDPEGIPDDDLAWLGDWMAIDLDETWPEAARRELVARAPELATKRGTGDGLLAVLRIYLRHTRPRSSWREALEIDIETLVDLVRERPLTDAETRSALGDHDDLRSLSGEPALRHMIVAWSRVLDRQRALLDAMVAAAFLAEEDREDYGTPVALIRDSDEGSLRYLVEYATVLEDVIGLIEHDAIGKPDVEAMLETYERLVRDAAIRSGPLLLEGPDLDCIDNEDVLARYAALVSHERGFGVLAGPGVEGDRMRSVRRIVAGEQPAHAAGAAVRLRPWIQLGGHSYLGINSGLLPRELVLQRAHLGDDSVLNTRERFAQLGVKSRLGKDSFIS